MSGQPGSLDRTSVPYRHSGTKDSHGNGSPLPYVFHIHHHVWSFTLSLVSFGISAREDACGRVQELSTWHSEIFSSWWGDICGCVRPCIQSRDKANPCPIVEFLSDIIGTIVPLMLLWRISLPPKERRLVHGAISASLLTALSGIVTCAFWFIGGDMGKDVQIVLDGVHHQQVQSLLHRISSYADTEFVR